jgi:hypothetical protein
MDCFLLSGKTNPRNGDTDWLGDYGYAQEVVKHNSP